jgi:outer membrane lipoprotein carrier protein
MKTALLPFLMALFISAKGQNDPQALKILDSFSSNASKAPSVSMKFRMINVNQPENTIDSVNGSIILSKNKYHLTLGDNIIWFNGETTWNYLPAEKEVTITKPDKKDHSFQNHPSDIYTMYKSGYKCRLIDDEADICIIDLYPDDIKSDLIRVRLTIKKPELSLIGLEYKRKDGIVITLHISDYNLREKPDADTFVFKAEKYKGVEINDMR